MVSHEPRIAFESGESHLVFSSGGRLCITYGDQSYGFANQVIKKENRVFPIFSQKEDGEFSTAQLSAQSRISGSRSFVGSLLEKALVVFVKSQVLLFLPLSG